MTSCRCTDDFHHLVVRLYVHGVSHRGMVRILKLEGYGVGSAPPQRDLQAVASAPSDEPQDRRLSGVGFDGKGWFGNPAPHGTASIATDDAPVYSPATLETGSATVRHTQAHAPRGAA